MNSNRYLLIIALGLILAVVIGCSSDDAADLGREPAEEYIVEGDKPSGTPEWDPNAMFTVADLDGKMRQSSEWIGRRPVVLNFWGTWCPPCRREIPELVKLYDEFKDQGVEIIGIALERRADPSQVKQYAQQAGMDWVILYGDQEVAQTYQVNSVPTLVFYDAQGNQVSRFAGLQSEQTIRAGFESII